MDAKTQRQQRLSKLLKSKREEMGLSQRDIARELGFTQATIHQWEAGKNEPDTANLKKLAIFFGYTMEEFWIYLDGNGSSNDSTWDLSKILGALDTMPPGDLVKISNAVVQKLAKV